MTRQCKFCGETLGDEKRSHAIFCTITCKKAEEHLRRIKNPEKRELNRIRAAQWRKENLKRAKEKVANWQKINVSKCRSNGRRYALSKRRSCPSWLTSEQKKEIELFYWLAKDLSTISEGVYDVDHIVPLQGKDVCGLHVPWNLQVLPADLNISKRNKL